MNMNETLSSFKRTMLPLDLLRLIYLVQVSEEITGTKKIQRLAWIAKTKYGVPFEYKFETPHWWPPHDSYMDEDIEVICNLGFVRADLKFLKDHFTHEYLLSKKGKDLFEYVEEGLSDVEKQGIRETVKDYGKYSEPEITLIAMRMYEKM